MIEQYLFGMSVNKTGIYASADWSYGKKFQANGNRHQQEHEPREKKKEKLHLNEQKMDRKTETQ